MSESIKNILFSVVAIAAVSLLAVGVTTAVFTTNATSTGNTFAAGDLSIEIGNSNVGMGAIVNEFFDADGLFPGDETSAYVEIANTSNENIEFEIGLTNADPIGSQELENVLELQVTHILDEYPVQKGDQWRPYTQDRVWISFEDGNTIRDLRRGTLVDDENNSIEFANRTLALPAGETAVYKVDVRLAENAGNSYQGMSFSTDIEVTAKRFED